VEPAPAAGRGVKAIGQTVVVRVMIQGLNAGTGIMTARLLLPAGRGQLAAITLWSSFLAGLTTFDLPSALIFYLRNRPKQTGDLLVNGLVMSTLLWIAAALVGVVCMPTWLHQYPLFVLAQAFMALGRPGTVTLLQAVGLGLSVPLMLLLIPRFGIAGAAVSLLISTCARFAFLYASFPVILKMVPPSLRPQREDFEVLRGVFRRFERRVA